MSGIKEKVLGFKTRLRYFREEFGKEFMVRVMERTPVRTGLLQASWDFRLVDSNVEIRNNVEYASYVERGSERMEGRFMLATTAEEAEQIAEVAIERAEARRK